MKNLSIYLIVALCSFLSACNSLVDDEIFAVGATEQSTRSSSNFEPDVCYGIEEYNEKNCQTLAGHSFNVGDYVYLPSGFYGICVDKEFYGSVDAAIVEVYSSYEPTNNISFTGMTASTSIQAAPVGGSVNLYGNASGNLSGTVSNTNFAGYVDGQFLNDIVEVNYTTNSNEGDSGGLVYTSNGFTNYTTGTHIGRLPNSNYSYYTKFQNIVSVFGATRY